MWPHIVQITETFLRYHRETGVNYKEMEMIAGFIFRKLRWEAKQLLTIHKHKIKILLFRNR